MTNLHVPAAVLLAVLAWPATGSAQHPPAAPAQKPAAPAADGSAFARDLRSRTAFLLEDAAIALDGVVGYAIGDLTSGDGFERMSEQPFPTASIIKLAILYDLVKRADERTLSLDDTIVLDRKRAVPGGLLYELGTPTLSLRDYATAMILESDNTATNVLIDRLGLDAVTRRMAGLGLGSIKLRRYMIDLDAAKRGLENVGTPADIGRLLQAFYKGDGLSAGARREALAILEKPKNTPVRRAVPGGITIASKVGGLEGVRGEAAIVYAKNRPFVFVVLTTYLQDDDAGDKAIERLAQVAYGYFSRLGAAAPETGRQLGR